MRYFLLLCGVFSLNATAQNSGGFVGFSAVQSIIKLSKDFDGDRDSFGSAGGGGHVGYQFENNFVTQVSLVGTRKFSAFGLDDRYSLHHFEASLGYRFRKDYISFIPKVGYSYWNLDGEEGQFFNSGAEEKRNLSGVDFVLGASLGFSLSSMLDMSITYQKTDTEFGEYSLSQLEFSFSI